MNVEGIYGIRRGGRGTRKLGFCRTRKNVQYTCTKGKGVLGIRLALWCECQVVPQRKGGGSIRGRVSLIH